MSERRYVATKEDWEISPMPEKTVVFKFKRRFTKEEIESIKCGHIPSDMDDRWFTYFEDNKLYIHRSWSGICIYIVEFNFGFFGKHKVTVNRDEREYTCTDIEEDKSELEFLLKLFS